MTSAPTALRVRYKRCPQCGDIALLSAPVCSCCDRMFVTTARYARRNVSVEVASSLAPTPYVYSDQGEFVVLSQKRATPADFDRYSPFAIPAAAVGLGWLGMILNGQLYKGATIACMFFMWLVCTSLVASQSQVMLLFSIIAGLGGYLVSLTDVICISLKRRSLTPIGDWDWF